MNKNEIIKDLKDWIEEYESAVEVCTTQKTIAENSGEREDALIYETQMYDYKEISKNLKHLLIKAMG